jgi:hypothetical protein
MNPFRYTNPTSSDWNPQLYSKQVGGNECNMTCKNKCKKNCATFCQIAKEDKTEFKEAMDSLKERRNRLKENKQYRDGFNTMTKLRHELDDEITVTQIFHTLNWQ